MDLENLSYYLFTHSFIQIENVSQDGYFDEILGNTFYSNMAPQWALKSGFYHRRVTIINFPVPAGRLAVVSICEMT